MKKSIFEIIEYERRMPAKVFITSIDKSSYHWHYDYELLVVLKGSLQVCGGTSEPRIFKEGEIIFFNSKSIHALYRTEDENICLFIQFKKSLFESEHDKNRNHVFYLDSTSRKMRPRIPYYHFVEVAARIGIAYESEDMTRFYRAKALIYEFVADLFEYAEYDIRQYANCWDEQEDSEIFVSIVDFIEMNFAKDSIEKLLSKHIGMSEKTIYRFLKRNTGLSIKDLIMETRMEEAKKMLKYSEKPITNIVCECGFQSEMTFYRSFKKYTGSTPNDYRMSGMEMERNPEVRGYMDFNRQEAIELLKRYLF